ncbi:hypothetical protein MGMO_8c00240 [Methyloglobulus morosus KoM1]|uniref:Secreted protein n=1 Tax=Methyloglobulus morosus KoM1 TaxID=1116472 RepID=V5C5Z7_9GAMM|nr:hypothetical protein [Methyloglobulus morosus]ESS73887.1 hypothetical protein MGMO_8c00240 [Methyloglobulus morosus KoM1]
MYTNKFTRTVAFALCSAFALPAAAAPKLIGDGDLKAAKTSYMFFYADPKKVKLTTATIEAQLQERLIAAGLNTTPCLIPADLNANNLVCGNAVRFGTDFFSFNSITNIPKPTLPFTGADKQSGLDRISLEFGVNGRSPALGQPNEAPRVVQIRFNKRIAQFGMVFDPFIVTNSPDLQEGRVSDGIQFIVNGQATPVRDFTQETRGNIPFVGVEDSHGFTELTIISTGGGSIIGDQFTIVPLANF